MHQVGFYYTGYIEMHGQQNIKPGGIEAQTLK